MSECVGEAKCYSVGVRAPTYSLLANEHDLTAHRHVSFLQLINEV